MTVFHLIKTSKGATWAIEMFKEQKRIYPNIKIVVALPKGGKHFNEYLEICDQVFELEYSLNARILNNGFKLRKFIRLIEPDLIHSWFTQTTLYARIFLRDFQIPRVFQVVGPAHLDNKLFKFFDIYSANKQDFWIATSKFIKKQYLKSGVDEKKIFLNYAYINIDKILALKDKTEPINYHKDLNLPSNTIVLGTASYIYPPKFYQKNGIKAHEQLIKGFSILSKTRDDIVLVIAGESFVNDSHYLLKLKKMADTMCPGKIFFTGGYKNVFRVIGKFDIFIYLSKMENLGGVFESLIGEIPTVSSNSGGLPELIIHGFTGLTSDYDDIKGINDNLTYLLKNPDVKERFVKNGFKHVLKTLNSSKMVENTKRIYDTVCFN
ncbi:glycosyltransferase family 4 protein [Nonlabens sp. SY33080]|uniref:glycosyltransferase family 4 protein n=1 Tax=Nonlabens sp. SY33080 TaxID=2719911 RepID=UPI001428D351|nr:glycosyltransferase family 4 protein [Nonlabens sp. SY33080]